MAIPSLTQEQVEKWSRLEKDKWWLANVYRGSMPQLTIRAGVMGFLLGSVLSATNLYVGAKTGWTLGVGLTSVILAFAVFRAVSAMGVRDLTILENNCSQSIATAAGYMTGPLISGVAAYMWVTNTPMRWEQMLLFNVVLSILGVLVAFPMKRKFINDEQQPFPEGRACGVVLDTLYTSEAKVGFFKAKALMAAAGLAGFISFISGENYMKLIQAKWLGLKQVFILPHNCDPIYAWLGKHQPRIANVTFKELAINPALDLAMFGAGGLMGIKSATSMLFGMFLNFFIIAPWMISIGEIKPKSGSVQAGDAVFGRAHILNNWSLWWGISIMVVASLVALFAKPEVFVQVWRSITGKREKQTEDPLKHIEVPLSVSWIGIPIVGAVGVWMAHEWFGVSYILGGFAILMIMVLTMVAASSTALTGITPTGGLSKIPQFTFGALDPKHPPTNLMTGVMCVEVASNASNLLMDIKPGYMLGGKPRHQAIGHVIGIMAGALASTPLFFLLFLSDYDANKAVQAAATAEAMGTANTYMQTVMAPDGGQFSFPSAVQWKGVSELVSSVFGGDTKGTLLTKSIVTSMIIAAVAGLLLEVTRILTKGKMWLSPLAVGLGVVVPPESTMAMFAGAAFFFITHKIYHARTESRGNTLWVQTHEPICAGIIAGAALVGIGDTLLKVLVFK